MAIKQNKTDDFESEQQKKQYHQALLSGVGYTIIVALFITSFAQALTDHGAKTKVNNKSVIENIQNNAVDSLKKYNLEKIR